MALAHTARFGELLKRYRIGAGLTQEELATRAGLSAKGISDLEAGRRLRPRADTVALLADALQLDERECALFSAAARMRPVAMPTSPTSERSATTFLLPLVGRLRELAALDAHLAGDDPPVLALAGEPGIGKSRLLQEAALRGRAQGWTVLEGGCHRRSGQEPYAPFLTLLERFLAHRSPAEQRHDLQGCAWLVRLLPELAATTATTPASANGLSPEQERRLMFAAVAQFLANVTGPAGTLLLLDDLQWAGSDALDLLAALLRRPGGPPGGSALRVVAAYRDTEVRAGEPLSVLLADLAREGLASRVELSPLATAEAALLLATLLPENTDQGAGLRAQLLQRAGGVPFFLVSCAQGLHAGTLSMQAQGSDIPWSVAETIRQRVVGLSPAAQDLLAAAAVIGRTAPRGLLLASTMEAGHSENVVLAAVEAVCQARLLVEEGEQAYQFPHDLIREVVGTDLSAARRVLLHRQVAEALERGPGAASAGLLAHHYSRGEVQAKALLYLERAGDHARALVANAEAAEYYRQLIERLEALGQDSKAAGIRERLAAVLAPRGRYEEALAALRAAAEAYQAAGDFEGQARALAQAGFTYGRCGLPEAGLALLQPFIATAASAPPSSALASLFAAQASLLYASSIHVRLRPDEQLAAAERAVRMARVVGDDRVLILAEDRLAVTMISLGRYEECWRTLEDRVIPKAEALGDLDALQRALLNLAIVAGIRGDYAAERHYTGRARAVAERTGDIAMVAYATCRRGLLAFSTGDWQTAWADLEQAHALMRQADVWTFSTTPALSKGQLCFVRGQREEASTYFEEVYQAGERATDNTIRIRALLAERELLEGHALAAREHLAPLLDDPYRTSLHMLDFRALQAWAFAATGDAPEGEALAHEVIAKDRALNMPSSLAEALHCWARIALQQERWQDARDALDELVALARSLPRPYTEAKALHVYGLLHAAMGEPGPAREQLREALAILSRLGERLYAEHVEWALRRL